MKQEEILALAREASIFDGEFVSCNCTSSLARYTALIEAKVKADLLAGAGEPVAARWPSSPGSHQYAGAGGCLPGAFGPDSEDLYTADQLAAAVLRGKRDTERQIAEALRQHGLTLVKVASGYEIIRLEQIAAQGGNMTNKIIHLNG